MLRQGLSLADAAAGVAPTCCDERLQQELLLRAKALVRLILVVWRRRPRVSLSLLRAPSSSDNPVAQGFWVKTQSSFWTSDGGVCGRRNLLGGVVFRDIVLLIGMVGLLFAVASSGDEVSVVCQVSRGLSTSNLVVGSLVGDNGSSLGCYFDCSQRSSAPGVAWQSPVRCETALMDSACSNGNGRGLGLQRIVAGFSARLKPPGEVQLRKTARATSSAF
jgi:hypothetical protein